MARRTVVRTVSASSSNALLTNAKACWIALFDENEEDDHEEEKDDEDASACSNDVNRRDRQSG